jgi:hypothetical protein
MIRFIATTVWRGIGNETVIINAKDHDDAFKKLFAYCLKNEDRLGDWVDANGKQAADFDDENGIFECGADWGYIIVEENLIKTI